jgi:predicted nucleic acid-binding protein
MKPTVYIETSVISYLTSRPSRDLIVAAHQQITHTWWNKALIHYDPYISLVVLEEISRGDARAAESRLDKIAKYSVLEVVPEVNKLASLYFKKSELPEKAMADSYHLALASWHGVDYLLSWNCIHIVNGRIRRIIDEINARQGIRTPVICTPEELMEF